jgi:hypothetical protein
VCHRPGPGGLPLLLRLSEGLGSNARGMRTDLYLYLHAGDFAPRPAPVQDQLRWFACTAHAIDVLSQAAPCCTHLAIGLLGFCFLVISGARHLVSRPHLSVRAPTRSPTPRRCVPLAAHGGAHVCLDRPAFTPALAEIRLFDLADGLYACSLDTWPSRTPCFGLLVAVSSTPTGALPAERCTMLVLLPNVRAKLPAEAGFVSPD